MRCPKCGFISFDNVETCLNCSKDIAETAKAFQGSTLNVTTPVFLKFTALDDDGETSLDSEGADEIEFADPDLEILVDEDEREDEADMEFAFGDDQEDDTAAAKALSEEFGSTESEEETQQYTEGALDLGMFEDTSEEETFAFEESELDEPPPSPPSMEIPEELSDISDLSPPDQTATPPPLEEEIPPVAAEEPESATPEEPAPLTAEPEDDLDFSNMDMDFDLSEDEPALAEEVSPAAEKAARSASRMNDDLNFELDLGGLSIHDDK